MSKEESTVEDLYNLHKSGEFDSNIKKMKLKDIKPNPNNPRVLRDDKFQKLKQSITEFPKMLSLRPMVIDENNVVLGGNMRLRALQELGFTDIEEAWVKRSSDLTDDEKKRFIIADNVAFGEWDWDTLANDWEAKDLNDWGLQVWKDDMTNNENYEGLDALSKLDKFMDAEIKRMFLVYDSETFTKVVNWFNNLQEKHNLEDNNQVILKLMENENI